MNDLENRGPRPRSESANAAKARTRSDPSGPDKAAPHQYVVDRLEGDRVVLLDDGDRQVDLLLSALPASCRVEGAVLRVPMTPGGTPDWAKSVRNKPEEKRRVTEAAERLERLRRRDAGGDIVL